MKKWLSFRTAQIGDTMIAMRIVRLLFFVILSFGLIQVPAGAQNFEKGLEAARAGDFAAAVAQWRPLASKGHVEAQFNIGAVYEEGLGVPKDPSEAAGWYGLAAGQGHSQAQYNLGVLYANGRGVPRDDARAAVWWRKAADQNHGKAQYNLGVFYQAGRGLRKDLSKAQIWFDRAAVNGVGVRGDSSRKPPPQSAADVSKSQPGPKVPTVVQPAKTEPTVKSQPQLTAPVNVAALSAGSLRVAANIPDGERFRLEVVETRERSRDGAFVMAQTSEMGVDMVVRLDPRDGAHIELTYGPATVKTAGNPQAGRLASELGKLIDGQKVEYHTNENGEVTGLENPAQLTSFYEKSIDRLLSGIETQSADPQLADDIRANMAPLLSQDYAAARALDLPKLLHFFSGLEMAMGKTYSRAGVMSLPPSANELPSTVNYELKWFDRTAGVAWMSWRQSVDSEQAAGAVQGYIETLVADSGQPLSEEFDIGAIDVSDNADYEIDLATGFPKQVIYTRKVELFGFSQTEKRRIRVLP